jgi:hypothetical protein
VVVEVPVHVQEMAGGKTHEAVRLNIEFQCCTEGEFFIFSEEEEKEEKRQVRGGGEEEERGREEDDYP